MAPPLENTTSGVIATYVTHLDISTGNNSHSATNKAVLNGILLKDAGAPDPPITTVWTSVIKPSNVLGYFADDPSSAYTCAGNSVAVTYFGGRDEFNAVACMTPGDTHRPNSVCMEQGGPISCKTVWGLCCTSESPYCVHILWKDKDLSDQRMYYCAMSRATTWLLNSQPTPASAPASITGDLSSSSQDNPTPSETTDDPVLTTINGGIFSPLPTSPTITPTGTAPSTSPSYNPYPVLTTGAKAGIGTGAALGLLMILLGIISMIFRKRRERNQDSHLADPNNNRGLQDHPEGDLPADIAPPARDHHSRAPSLGWRSQRSQSERSHDNNLIDVDDLRAGASEVPVDMRGRAAAPGTFELAASSSAGRLPRAATFELDGLSSHPPMDMPAVAAQGGGGVGGPRMYQAYQPPTCVTVAELEGSPVRRAPLGVGEDQYAAYQNQAAHPRYSVSMGSAGPEAPYRGPAPAAAAYPNSQYRDPDGM